MTQFGRTMVAGLMAIALLGLAIACEPTAPPAPAPRDRPLVVTTTPVLRALVESIAGDQVEVLCLARSAETVRDEAPGRADLAAAHDADLILAIGHGYERWLSTVSLPASRVRRVGETALPNPLEVAGPTHQHGIEGGHTHQAIAATGWLDPALAAALATAVGAQLEAILPDAQLEPRIAQVRDELNELMQSAQLESVKDTTFAATSADAVYLVNGLGAEQQVLAHGETPPEGSIVLVLPGDVVPPNCSAAFLRIEPTPGQSLANLLSENLASVMQARRESVVDRE